MVVGPGGKVKFQAEISSEIMGTDKRMRRGMKDEPEVKRGAALAQTVAERLRRVGHTEGVEWGRPRADLSTQRLDSALDP